MKTHDRDSIQRFPFFIMPRPGDVQRDMKPLRMFAKTKPEQPNEIPQPGKNPETVPAQEPGPNVWPQKEPEIKPGKEPLTSPPVAPPDVPAPPQEHSLLPAEAF